MQNSSAISVGHSHQFLTRLGKAEHWMLTILDSLKKNLFYMIYMMTRSPIPHSFIVKFPFISRENTGREEDHVQNISVKIVRTYLSQIWSYSWNISNKFIPMTEQNWLQSNRRDSARHAHSLSLSIHKNIVMSMSMSSVLATMHQNLISRGEPG